jgi:hypothetical protein
LKAELSWAPRISAGSPTSFGCDPQTTQSPGPKALLHKIIIALSKSGCDLKPFDCVTACAVRSAPLGLGIIVMMEAVTAFFGVISAGIFLAHAVDGYRSR